MKIKVDELPVAGRTIKIEGDEAWLQAIYESFPPENIKQNKRITGLLTVSTDGYGFAQVKGQLEFEPLLNCSRCSDLISWPIVVSEFFAEFRPQSQEFAKEIDLSAEELDYYYLDENSCVNLEELVNDLVQTALPTQYLKKCANGQSCAVCHCDLSEPLTAAFGCEENHSPFAILKNIKFDS